MPTLDRGISLGISLEGMATLGEVTGRARRGGRDRSSLVNQNQPKWDGVNHRGMSQGALEPARACTGPSVPARLYYSARGVHMML